ncbi:hypothetical protein K1T71_013271 [Dendrolimus kikuchii]|uniref:Uncharacterized protein n=1 Tax=Dendrolimus kikuchii TaxID=765133 RepID=A0ACC1CHX1_9NEOP|nr:hypothetical protein K1T71_013271 [Dendrolimus kikuchii]
MPNTRSRIEKDAAQANKKSATEVATTSTTTGSVTAESGTETSSVKATTVKATTVKATAVKATPTASATTVKATMPVSVTDLQPQPPPVLREILRRKECTLEETSRPQSLRSTTSRRRLAELEAKERLAALKLKQLEAAVELEQARINRLQAESSDDDDVIEESELPSRRVDMWFERLPQTQEPHATEPPPPPPPAPATLASDIGRMNERGQGVHVGNMARGQRVSERGPPARSNVMDVTSLAEAITEAARTSTRQAQRYMQELPTFNGNSGEWLSFQAAFRETGGSFSAGENVARLRRSLRGAALEAVSALLITQTGPEDILKALERRFGRPDALVLGEMEKMKTWTRVTDSPRDLCLFANKMANLVATIEVLNKPQYLHSPEMLRAAVEKLTPIVRNKWYDYAAVKTEGVPELKKLASFLNEEADKCAAYAPIERESEMARSKRRTEHIHIVNNDSERVNMRKSEPCPVCKRDHKLSDCRKFVGADVSARWDLAKKCKVCFRCLRSRHRRSSCRAPPCGVERCTLHHHRLLHHQRRPEVNEVSPSAVSVTSEPAGEVLASAINSVINDGRNKRRAYLKVAPVAITGPRGSRHTYALLDEGSTVTIIDAQLAEQLGLSGPRDPMKMQGVNGEESSHDYSMRVSARIRGSYETEEHTLRDARTIKNMSFFSQTVHRSDVQGCAHLQEIENVLIYERATPKILIGQDNWELIISNEVRKGPRHQPVASRTQLGWVLHGCRTSTTSPVVFCSHLNMMEEDHDPLEEIMKKYFALESLGIEPRTQVSDPQQRALEILEKKTRRLENGQFETGLLWKDESSPMPNNYENALKRLQNLEKKLDRDEELKAKYEERIGNLMLSGYAERASTPPTSGRTWYLPHFAVVNPDKEKIRVVHDAAAKYHGRSLNDMLLPGPDLLRSLPGVIMKYRQYPVAVSADIKEMFMQVKIIEADRDALRFLWRGNRRDSEPPEEYRMTSLIFGATSSPCVALYVKNKNAREFENEDREAARAIVVNHYMDDYLQSLQTVEEARKMTAAVDNIQRRAGFQLRGWTSNYKEAISSFAPSGQTTVEIGGSEIEKTLGLMWHVREDTLGFRVNQRRVPAEVLEGSRMPTKREALGLIMSIFDPLGFISPLTTPAKRIMQDTWKYKTTWDEVIPEELQDKWKNWLRDLISLPNLRIPRCYEYSPAAIRELHTFVDASEEAYAAVVYIRTTRADGRVNVMIAAAKSRVTPMKPVSIPRLELQAAVLGARLSKSVQEGHDWELHRHTYWSDSRTTLAWIRAEPRTYKTFVAHRLAEIEDLTKKNEWRWLPSAQNVADDATRKTPSDFNPQHRWFTGPKFLYLDIEKWPQETKTEVPTTGEEKCATLTEDNDVIVIDFKRFSRWTTIVRTMGRVLQFIRLCKRPTNTVAAARRKRTKKNPTPDEEWKKNIKKKNKEKSKCPKENNVERKFKKINGKMLMLSERKLIALAQRESFGDKPLDTIRRRHNKGELAGLTIETDEHNILRLRGRIDEAQEISYEMANPAILDGKHKYTKLYIQHVHEKLHHGGVEMVVNELRQRLWVMKIRPSVKAVLRNCLQCRLRRAQPASPSTGSLPAARLAHHSRPFTFTGVDYFGPLEVTVGRHREKRYVALFTCMTSRALHLEVVASLSADSAINALRRFIARRGVPTELWSDNATCFRSADRELAEAGRAVEEEASRRQIAWRFLPPAAPFMAGAWERMVRTVKEALRVTLREQRPSDETLATLLAEVEATVNSRPLTHVAVGPDEPPAITPNLLLLGPNCHMPAPGNFEASDVTARAHWRRAQYLADVFWRRWVREYLPLLQYRREPYASGDNPKVGDLVIICDPNLPRNTWPRGRVTAVHPGRDGEVRVLDVTTASGRVLRRPTKRKGIWYATIQREQMQVYLGL